MKMTWACGLAMLVVPVEASAQLTTPLPTVGEIVRLDPRIDNLLPQDTKIEVLASGFEWSEGPAWVKDGAALTGTTSDAGFLLFSDLPRNSVMKWDARAGLSLFLKPAGFTGVAEYGTAAGSNGLLINPQGELVLCEHGDRRVSVLTKGGGKRTLVDNYQGKRLNSPNDGCFKRNGDLYFTDPPYGLPKWLDDPARELTFCGVYRLRFGKDGVHTLTLLTDKQTFPNGIGFSPDERWLYVANSDFAAALWIKYPVNDDGTLGDGKVFSDFTQHVGKMKGLPDGLKIDRDGHVFATGPGGVWVFAPDGTPLGRIDTQQATANCAWGDDGSTLYLTADKYLCRVRTTTKGAGW
jgi:gluconolactonase